MVALAVQIFSRWELIIAGDFVGGGGSPKSVSTQRKAIRSRVIMAIITVARTSILTSVDGAGSADTFSYDTWNQKRTRMA